MSKYFKILTILVILFKLVISINIGLIGQVSVGKTTLVNSFLGKYIGNTGLKRTTYKPFKFISSNTNDINILKQIDFLNKNIADETNIYSFNVNYPWFNKSIYDIYSFIDFPGFNDPKEKKGKMEKILFDNLNEIDCIIYIIKSNLGLNTRNERDLIETLIKKINEYNERKDKFIEITFVFNLFEEEDDELIELIDEGKEFINSIALKYNIYDINYFNINIRNIMIKKIIETNIKHSNYKQLCNIPKSVMLKTLINFHGKTKANQIYNQGLYYNQNTYDSIELTLEENNFLNYINNFITTKYYFNKIYQYIKEKLYHMKNSPEFNWNSKYNNENNLKNMKKIYKNHFSKYIEYINKQTIFNEEEKYNLFVEKTIISIDEIFNNKYKDWENIIKNSKIYRNKLSELSNLISILPINNINYFDTTEIIIDIISEIPVFNNNTKYSVNSPIYYYEIINIHNIIKIISEKKINNQIINKYIKSRIKFLNSIRIRDYNKNKKIPFFRLNENFFKSIGDIPPYEKKHESSFTINLVEYNMMEKFFNSEINLKYFTEYGLLDLIELIMIKDHKIIPYWKQLIFKYGSYGKNMVKKYIDHLKKENALDEYKIFIDFGVVKKLKFDYFPEYVNNFINYRKNLEGINTNFEYPQLLM